MVSVSLFRNIYHSCQILIPAYVQFYQFIMVTIQQCQVSLVFDIQLYQLIYRAIQLF